MDSHDESSEARTEVFGLNAVKDAAKVKAGLARAQALTPNKRSEIAKKAAEARWGTTIARATHSGTLKIGTLLIPCAVLEDGTRVLTQEGFLKAIGRSGKPAAGRGSQVEKVAPFLDLANLKPFIDKDLADSTKPILFRVPSGSRAYGYNAELLPKVCEVYLQARDNESLLKTQERFAKACDILMRGLARVGIIALVDEATGFQADRGRHALEEILERFISKELLKWAKTFPDEFYVELFRLKAWQYDTAIRRSPVLAAKLTNNLVYERLAPGVLDELKRLTPKDSKGRRKLKYHQRLTEEIGHPRLREPLWAVIALMRAAEDWDGFYRSIQRALPKQIQMPLFDKPSSNQLVESVDELSD